MTRWRLPLRLARRDALRHRGRSVLVLVMIALPVLAVTAADVVMQTTDVSGVESIDRRMGSAAALVRVETGVTSVEQGPDPDQGFGGNDFDGKSPMPTAAEVGAVLGGARLLELLESETKVITDKGRASASITEVDVIDPVTDGLFDLASGRWPTSADEVAVNQAMLDKGYAVGGPLDLADQESDPTIVGLAESTTQRDFPLAVGQLGSLGVETESTQAWLVDGDPVTWDTVLELNAIGATVASRTVITDPPPASEIPESVISGGLDEATVAVLVLIVVMALIEVVLLAGPAFAVGARKQQRSLALMAAAGGTPKQSRRVVVASAIVLGGAAAVGGVLLGIGIAWLLLPLVQSLTGTWLGPFDVPWPHLLGIAAFGLISAFLASVVPAHLASRQDVVAVLAGRRGDRPPSLRSPLLGLVLLGVGVAGSAYGALAASGGEIFIAASAIPAVLGMILLIPTVLALLARLSRRLPLVLRYAVRDSARHRTRTVPAVAAVAATVAGVVALGIGLTSDAAQNRETYEPSVADGVGIVTDYGTDIQWDALGGVLEREAPEADVMTQLGLEEDNSFTEVFGPGDQTILFSSGSSLGANIMVSDDELPVGLIGVRESDVAAAERALRAGRMVAFVSPGVEVSGDTAHVTQVSYDAETGADEDRQEVDIPARFVVLTAPWAGPAAVLSTEAARTLGVEPTTVSLGVSTLLSEQQEQDVNEGLAAVSDNASLYVERGYQTDDGTMIAQLVLVGLGGVLMLGGTLTATFLALSDARPDLATLSAVGASPRTRRGVAGATALVVGMVGAGLGAVVGFIPGIAVAYPLTSQSFGGCVVDSTGACAEMMVADGPYVDIPWLMVLGLVVALPLFTALIVSLFARSRLPLVARLD